MNIERTITAFVGATLAALALYANAACSPLPLPDPEDASTEPDAGADTCAALCATITRLGCPGAEGSPGPDDELGTSDDWSCARACEDIVAGGGNLERACVSGAKTCDEVDACFGSE